MNKFYSLLASKNVKALTGERLMAVIAQMTFSIVMLFAFFKDKAVVTYYEFSFSKHRIIKSKMCSNWTI